MENNREKIMREVALNIQIGLNDHLYAQGLITRKVHDAAHGRIIRKLTSLNMCDTIAYSEKKFIEGMF